MNISSTAGGIDLTGTAVTAGKDITLSAGSGDILLGGANGSHKDMTSSGGNITAVAGGNLSMGYMNISASGSGKDITLLAGNTTTDGTSSMFMDKETNITAGGNFTAGAGAGNSGGISFSSPHADGNTISAGNDITINVTAAAGMSTAGLNLNATSGNLTINAGKVESQSVWTHNVTWSAGKHLTVVSDGDVKWLANDNKNGGGNTVLSGKEGVSVTSNTGNISLYGTGNNKNKKNSLSNVTVNSTDGDITLQAAKGSVWLQGSKVDGKPTVSVTADKGNITINGNGGNSVGVYFQNTNLSAGNMTVTGSTTGGASNSYSPFGGIHIFGKADFHVKEGGKGIITGTAVNKNNYLYAAGIEIGRLWDGGTEVLFDGDFDIKGEATGPAEKNTVGGIFFDELSTNITMTRGNITLSADGYGGASGITSMYSDYSYANSRRFNLQSNAKLIINASSDSGTAFSSIGTKVSPTYSYGFVFSGLGDVEINAHSNSSSEALYANNFDNKDLNGSFSINAVNKNGDAVVFPGYTQINLVNATINGTSESGGAGIRITTNNNNNGVKVNLGNNTLNGISHSGDGININGKNITITNGTLNGS
ncbi:hypothetical protein E3366_25275, partial [Salmonella enterica subsp. enterica serovar Poona]|nr:hypothetical protein [Salmonella enterica subsp. enterica serovar Poona]